MLMQYQVPVKKVVKALLMLLLVAQTDFTNAQQKIFHKVDLPGIPANTYPLTSIIQDRLGYIWIAAYGKGLLKYDGSKVIAYVHDEKNSNSIVSASSPEVLATDNAGDIWIGTEGEGLDKFDSQTNTFTHFRHKANDPGSLLSDTIGAILEDHLGNLWVGTFKGLDLLNRKTGKFTHYTYNPDDPHSLSDPEVRSLYEDTEGKLWVGCGWSVIDAKIRNDGGGLNLFHRTTGKFTRFLHNPDDPGSIANNKVLAMLEDSKGNFWVGTAGDGLQILNRQTGKFLHYYYDSTHPDRLSRGPLYNKSYNSRITFIKEDAKGKIWIGTFYEGIVEYDPGTKKVTHHGYIRQPGKIVAADTLTGFNDDRPFSALLSKDGLLWISTTTGHLYNISPTRKVVLPFTKTKDNDAFYKSPDGTLWIGAGNRGLLRRNTKTGKEVLFAHDPLNPNSLINNSITDIEPDGNGSLWIGLWKGGLEKLNPVTNQFTPYYFDPKNDSTVIDSILVLYQDDYKNLWIGTFLAGLVEMNATTGKCVLFKHDDKDSNSLVQNGIMHITGNKKAIWFVTYGGLDKIEIGSDKFYHYLKGSFVTSVLIDAKGIIWAGTMDGLYKYDSAKNTFLRFKYPSIEFDNINGLIKDKNDNIWISSTKEIVEIKSDRKNIRIFKAENNIDANSIYPAYICSDDEVFVTCNSGYYHFYPDSIKDETYPPYVNFASLQIGGKAIEPGKGNILNSAIYNTSEIKLPNNKTSFSIGFSVIDFRTSGENKVEYMLENYDNQWHETNEDHTAYFYNLPVGHYTLRVRATNEQGAWSEKTLVISIMPPWWQTWWGITLFIIALIAIVLGFSYYRSVQLRQKNKLLEEKVKHRTAQLQKSLEDLKSTQMQLVQQEKMASLGELTAGIAHEIQNPLNFVNNFSEVNREMISEMKDEIDKGNYDEVKIIANDIEDNEEKINHHGKRADAIVKGMLQHSRQSSGKREPTDINALCDEYLRLSYHGMRAKDKSFDADFKTDFDESFGKINIVPQDIGRVLLNLFNNAFYACNELSRSSVNKQKNGNLDSYQPTVSVSTKKSGNSVLITVSDNGCGIHSSIKEKIFQPFFTTKPTGQGTGLGLSLSYDIVKAHGGAINVESKENEARPDDPVGRGTTFTIQLPV
jgi:signal transduction histidine kinase/ligand-binding sensor domain-containing protein